MDKGADGRRQLQLVTDDLDLDGDEQAGRNGMGVRVEAVRE